ncbi:MAG TPA: DNA-3-methyladenine glycosylase, partial [Paludibacter sp.]|nr:DNA-3-methyladenine glycosylase [Paludibacter sp.]
MAPQLLGKILVRQYEDGRIERYRINETEAYCGIEDLASHASKGRTSRTDVMFEQGGTVYVYLIYGMYWMLNIVAGKEHTPEAVLIRGVEGVVG